MSLPPDLPFLFRPRDLERFGLTRDTLRGMLRRGEVEPVARGVYRVSGAPLTAHETLAAVCLRVPQAVVCLLSALSFHAIGTQIPPEVWIYIDRKARVPKLSGLPVRVVPVPPRMTTFDVEDQEVDGVCVRVTSPSRTVADCFRFRRLVGLDVALEALKDVLRSRRVTIDEIVHASRIVGVESEIQPYLEAVLA